MVLPHGLANTPMKWENLQTDSYIYGKSVYVRINITYFPGMGGF